MITLLDVGMGGMVYVGIFLIAVIIIALIMIMISIAIVLKIIYDNSKKHREIETPDEEKDDER